MPGVVIYTYCNTPTYNFLADEESCDSRVSRQGEDH